MRFLTRCVGGLAALLLCGWPRHGMGETQEGAPAAYVGSTPADTWVREFLGGLGRDAACHSIVWRVNLQPSENNGLPTRFELRATYRVPARGNPNRSEDGPEVLLNGTWEIPKGGKPEAGSVVYRLTRSETRRSLSLVKIGDHLLHVLTPHGSLAIGNGGQSYTLNLADRAERPGDQSQVNSAPQISYKISRLATGPTVFGVFEGRTPCHGISRELGLNPHAGCIKSKWRVTLHQNPVTSAPTTYRIEGSLFREGAREGTWSVSRLPKTDPNGTVYQLSGSRTQPALALLKGDDNVLYFLNRSLELLVGHGDFSYTLNRVAAK